MKRSRNANKLLIGSIELIVGFTAITGGIALIFTNGLGMPISYLSHSPFQSFLFPGVILATLVGGSQVLAFWLLLKKHKYMYESAAFASFSLLGWIFGELYFIGHAHLLQVIYFLFGSLILISILLQQRQIIRMLNGKK